MRGYIFEAVLSPDEEGGYDVAVPDLPGCFTHGDNRMDALAMAADAMRTYVASLLLHEDSVPAPSHVECGEGEETVPVYFETDETYIVTGEVISAAEASRRLGVSAGRVTRMIDSGVLDGFRQGRRTYVTVQSVSRRLAEGARPGRPRSRASA